MAELSAAVPAGMSGICGFDHDRVKIVRGSVRGGGFATRSDAVDVSGLSTALPNVPSARLQLDVSTAVLDKALDTSTHASLALVDALSVSEPPGLTFSPAGLSPGRTSRFVADL
jgi:hypothetical protein